MPPADRTSSFAYRSGKQLLDRVRSATPLVAVELRPPRVAIGQGFEPWIDMYHAVRRLAAQDTLIFTTDNALGAAEEESLRHLATNLGADADLSRVVPFLTIKHSLDYCLQFPARALEAGHRAVVTLGGDTHDGVARCVPHTVELRRLLRDRYPGLALGGWANPRREAGWQVELLKREEAVTDFFLTQVVSHHDLAPVAAFLREAERQELKTPGLFGVFYYRSGNARTLASLGSFVPVPREGLLREFGEEGLDADQVLGRTLTALRDLGVLRYYVCNLRPQIAAAKLNLLRRQTG